MSSKSPQTKTSAPIDQTKVKIESPVQPVITMEDLVRKIAILEEERVKEGRARNYLQLERDRILQFWDITKARLAAAEAALRHKTLEMEEQQATHSVTVKIYRDRIRSLVASHGIQEAEAKVASETAMQQHTLECAAATATAQEIHQTEQRRAREEVQTTKHAQNESSLECERRIEQRRAEFESNVASVHDSYEKRLADQVHNAEERCQAQVLAAASQRDAAVARLEARHELFLQETREHHAATVARQLDLVAALKGDLQAARAGTLFPAGKQHLGKHNNNGSTSTASSPAAHPAKSIGDAQKI